jgi:hypothetical protein
MDLHELEIREMEVDGIPVVYHLALFCIIITSENRGVTKFPFANNIFKALWAWADAPYPMMKFHFRQAADIVLVESVTSLEPLLTEATQRL